MNYLRTEGADKVFGSATGGRDYKCLSYHRNPRSNQKSCWCVTESKESDCYEESETHRWSDENGHHWWIGKDGAEIVGTKGERLAFFPRPSNDVDPAHGYPVSTLQTSYVMDETLIILLEKKKRIDRTTVKKLRTRRI